MGWQGGNACGFSGGNLLLPLHSPTTYPKETGEQEPTSGFWVCPPLGIFCLFFWAIGFCLFVCFIITFLIMRNTDRTFETGSQRLCISKNLKMRSLAYFHTPASSLTRMGSYLKGTLPLTGDLRPNAMLIPSLFGENFRFIPAQWLLKTCRFNFSATISQVFVLKKKKNSQLCGFCFRKKIPRVNFAFRLQWGWSSFVRFLVLEPQA